MLIACHVQRPFVRSGRRWDPVLVDGRPTREVVIHLSPADARAFEVTGDIEIKPAARRKLEEWEAQQRGELMPHQSEE